MFVRLTLNSFSLSPCARTFNFILFPMAARPLQTRYRILCSPLLPSLPLSFTPLRAVNVRAITTPKCIAKGREQNAVKRFVQSFRRCCGSIHIDFIEKQFQQNLYTAHTHHIVIINLLQLIVLRCTYDLVISHQRIYASPEFLWSKGSACVLHLRSGRIICCVHSNLPRHSTHTHNAVRFSEEEKPNWKSTAEAAHSQSSPIGAQRNTERV